jgi:hypothetical protein
MRTPELLHYALDVTMDPALVVVDHGELSCAWDGLCFCLVDRGGTPKVSERGLMHIALPCVILTHVPLRSNDQTRH